MINDSHILHGDQTTREENFYTRSITNADARSACGS